ncbi:MAG: transposase [Deltaproteobacteria bacterium]|nr:transposase [Deltaproteobacteria bacterium]
MARISRIIAVGHPHHLTQRGVRSMAVFQSDADRLCYLQHVKEETERFGVEILSWCLMTNHVHFIAVPREETSFARGFGEAHRKYTRMKNFADGVRGYLFQGRFSSCVLDERHLIAAAHYVETNPVRAGMVKAAWDYPWSSAAYHTGQAETDILVADRTLLGLVEDWQTFLADAENRQPEALRLATRTGRPAGDPSFIASLEHLTGRTLKPGKRGRPVKSKPENGIVRPEQIAPRQKKAKGVIP